MIDIKNKVMDVHIMVLTCIHYVMNKKCYRITPASFKIKATQGASETLCRETAGLRENDP